MLDRGAEPPRLVMLAPPSAPGRAASGIEIDLRAGFGEDAKSIPPPLRLAVRLLAARWFEHRGDEPDAARDAPLPRTCDASRALSQCEGLTMALNSLSADAAAHRRHAAPI